MTAGKSRTVNGDMGVSKAAEFFTDSRVSENSDTDSRVSKVSLTPEPLQNRPGQRFITYTDSRERVAYFILKHFDRSRGDDVHGCYAEVSFEVLGKCSGVSRRMVPRAIAKLRELEIFVRAQDRGCGSRAAKYVPNPRVYGLKRPQEVNWWDGSASAVMEAPVAVLQ
jgi:hypothetical protein